MRKVKPYTYFSKIYNHLMKNVDYDFWADYLKELHSTIGSKSDLALELGCGSGKLSENLRGEFKELYLTDISIEMLKMNPPDLPKICCDMKTLPFKVKFDFIFSTFDTINYITDNDELKQFFIHITNNLSSKGFFTFDVSLRHNSIKHVKDLNRKGIYKKIKYVQISEFDEETLLHTNEIKIRTPEGLEYEEVHIQKIYDYYYYFDILENSGLYVVECFNAFDFTDGKPDSERLQFIVKRKD